MAENEANSNIDLAELGRLNKWLLAFFSGFWIGFVALMILPKEMVAGAGPIVSILILVWAFCSWGYLITLGRMAVRLNKSWMVWCGLTMIFSLLGFLVSYPWMQNEIGKAREKPVITIDNQVDSEA